MTAESTSARGGDEPAERAAEPPDVPEIPGLLDALRPLETALVAYHRGQEDVVLRIRFDDGGADRLPASHFFRTPPELDELERRALALVRGRVLDVGAGAGAFTLPLQDRGHTVTALEILPGAAQVLRERGALDVREESVWAFRPDGPYDTILLLMNGTGVAGTRRRLPLLLRRLASWLRRASGPGKRGGQILVDSTALEDGDIAGEEVQIQLALQGGEGQAPHFAPPFPHLYAPPEALRRAAAEAGLDTEVVTEHRDPSRGGDGGQLRYLARLTATLALVLAGLWGCDMPGRADGADLPRGDVTGPPGEPVPGLEGAELALFRAGEALFDHPFSPEEGLGPLFNEDRCSACHDLPESGGAGAERVRKATAVDPSGRCDVLVHAGGDNFQRRATPLLRAAGIDGEPLPRGRSVTVAEIAAPSLYGLGLVEAVPDATLLEWADPDDADGDGISGRGARTSDGRLGRFGRKATHATLRSFVVEALATEMGLTTPDRSTEERVAGRDLPPGVDPAPEPELGGGAVDALVAYNRYLAPAPPTRPEDGADRELVARGEALFDRVGCAGCHRPLLTTGHDPVPALDRRTFRIYSDFLLHDLGRGMATICGADAGPSEFRTAPLVGLRHRTFFLHDGRAEGADDAVRSHGGEALAVRRRYEALSPVERRALMAFVMSL